MTKRVDVASAHGRSRAGSITIIASPRRAPPAGGCFRWRTRPDGRVRPKAGLGATAAPVKLPNARVEVSKVCLAAGSGGRTRGHSRGG